jgi:hypothetical protein
MDARQMTDGLVARLRVDVLMRGEPCPHDRAMLDGIERAIAERLRNTSTAPRFALVVGAQAAPQDVRATLEAIA